MAACIKWLIKKNICLCNLFTMNSQTEVTSDAVEVVSHKKRAHGLQNIFETMPTVGQQSRIPKFPKFAFQSSSVIRDKHNHRVSLGRSLRGGIANVLALAAVSDFVEQLRLLLPALCPSAAYPAVSSPKFGNRFERPLLLPRL